MKLRAEELNVHKKARRQVVGVYHITSKEFMIRDADLARQMRRAAVSVPSKYCRGEFSRIQEGIHSILIHSKSFKY